VNGGPCHRFGNVVVQVRWVCLAPFLQVSLMRTFMQRQQLPKANIYLPEVEAMMLYGLFSL
jgi:hypothetical protein